MTRALHALLQFTAIFAWIALAGWSSKAEATAVERHSRSLASSPHEHLARSYMDHRRILIRPLLHLGMSEEPGDEGYPLMYLSSAFLGG